MPIALMATADHPRIRGEHEYLGVDRDDHAGIIPAYAGSTLTRSMSSWQASDHPRIRGEHCWLMVPLSIHFGSSPHTRGALPRDLQGGRRGRIIPAYAGSTRCRWCAIRPGRDHPRIRGEHSPSTMASVRRHESSPHTRGALSEVRQIAEEARIIPAYAGST